MVESISGFAKLLTEYEITILESCSGGATGSGRIAGGTGGFKLEEEADGEYVVSVWIERPTELGYRKIVKTFPDKDTAIKHAESIKNKYPTVQVTVGEPSLGKEVFGIFPK